jgi:4-aminobutyrate aminotransferase-like enzyme
LNVIRLVPPMTTSDAEIGRALSIMRDAIAAVSARGRRTAAAAE